MGYTTQGQIEMFLHLTVTKVWSQNWAIKFFTSLVVENPMASKARVHQWLLEDWRDVTSPKNRGHQVHVAPGQRRKEEQEKKRDGPSFRWKKSAKTRSKMDQSRSKSWLKSTNRHKPKSPVYYSEQLQERPNFEHDNSWPSSPRPRYYNIEKSLEVLIQNQE